MAERGGGVATPTKIEAGFIARAAGAVRFVLTGKDPNAFFGPGQPLAPVAQETAVGRAWDYPTAYNINTKPRQGEPIDFPSLRALADNYDLIRLAVETRKDQLATRSWNIKPKDDSKPGRDAKAIEDFLQYPDQEHDWADWYRMLLEDLLVLDAPVIYVRKTKGGAPFALEQIDGATIRRVLDATGRTPLAPNPAYQQIIKGLPAVDYTRDELLYMPRNLRVHKGYGFGPVEQIIMIVNIALRREMFQLAYYTDGNVPDVLLGVPDNWSAKQLSDFQVYWDNLMTDDMARRRKVKFVPGAMKPIPTREPTLKDEMDEWLARVVCYAFSIPPTPFIKQMNRATGQTAQEVALEEGMGPVMDWTKRKMDRIIARVFGKPELEFVWEDQQDIDPAVQTTIDDLNIRNGSQTVNEVRADRGDEPLEGGDEPGILGAPAPMVDPFGSPNGDDPSTTPPNGKDGKKAPSGKKPAAGKKPVKKPGKKPASLNPPDNSGNTKGVGKSDSPRRSLQEEY